MALYRNLSFDFIRDIAPVAGVCRYAGVMVVNPSVPAETVPEFIVYAKANPGKMSMGSGGAGTPSHLYGELFKKMTGVELVHVPFRGGGPAVIALLSGQVQVFFGTVSVRSTISGPASCELARGNDWHAHGRVAARSARERFRVRLRGERVGMRRRAQGLRPRRSSTRSTRKSMRPSSMPTSSHASPIWGWSHSQARLPSSAGSSSTIRRSGAS